MSWRLDPDAGDYVLTAGHFEQDETLVTAVALRLFSRRGEYLDDPTFGSRLHELERRKSAEAAASAAADVVAEALRPLLDEGRIAALATAAEAQSDRLLLCIDITDSQDRPYRFRVFQPVG